jgi:hypothetical protein
MTQHVDDRKLIRIADVQVLAGYQVRLRLTDNTEKVVDLEPYLRGPIFEPIRQDRALFAAVCVNRRAGTIVWPNGADIDPDVLCAGLQPAGSAGRTRA